MSGSRRSISCFWRNAFTAAARILVISCAVSAVAAYLQHLSPAAMRAAETPVMPPLETYQLGPEDSLLIHVKDEPEIPDGPYQIDLNGDLRVPELGSVHAAGKSLNDVSGILTERCRRLLQTPTVHVAIAEYRSQRVSILGAVVTPGVQQIRGRKTLYEVISDAGGLRAEAGGTIQISRKVQAGSAPLEPAVRDASGRFDIARIDVHDLMSGHVPSANIAVQPDDVITVPRAELVYVLGAVRKAGGFELVETQSISVMQALSLAGGPERAAGTRHARILHAASGSQEKAETPIDLSELISGKRPDVMLKARDILIVPSSNAKAASYRMLEAIVSTGTGVAIYRPY